MIRPRHLVMPVIGLALIGVLSACGSSSSHSPSMSGSSMMGDAAATGSAADIAFAQLMIPHHEQAVEMADLALANASSADVKQLAEQIKGAQDPEIMMMGEWLTAWGAPMEMPAGDHSGVDMGGMSMSGMMSDDDMNSLASAMGADFDQMWLQMMIAHHQGAIEMAQQVLASTSDPDVAKLAQAVVDGQTTEIDTMQKLLAS